MRIAPLSRPANISSNARFTSSGTLKSIACLNGEVDRALFWYRNEPLQPFGYKTAERLVSEGRSDDVLRYVMSLEAGPAG